MEILKSKKIYICGIGGIGLSALARILNEKGIKIYGSDQTKSDLTKELEKENIKIYYEHNEKNIPEDIDLFLYSTAIPESNSERKYAEQLKIPTLTYAEALGNLSKNYKLIAVAGTHGKSTTTAMISLILKSAKIDPTIVIGTLLKELNNKNYQLGKSDIMLIEACEYKDAFLNYNPEILVLTTIEADHLDYFKTEENYFKSFENFIKKVPENGYIIYNPLDENTKKIIKSSKANKIPWTEENIHPKVPGNFNVQNANAALKVAEILKIDKNTAEESIKNFSGTWRRMEIKETSLKGPIFIDDYGHHPTEIQLTLDAIRKTHPKAKILCIFQPHQYNRTKEILNGFAKSFTKVNQVIIPDIYEVRDSEEDKKLVSREILVNEINKVSNNAISGKSLDNTIQIIKSEFQNWDIIITMGAGNINNIYKEI